MGPSMDHMPHGSGQLLWDRCRKAGMRIENHLPQHHTLIFICARRFRMQENDVLPEEVQVESRCAHNTEQSNGFEAFLVLVESLNPPRHPCRSLRLPA